MSESYVHTRTCCSVCWKRSVASVRALILAASWYMRGRNFLLSSWDAPSCVRVQSSKYKVQIHYLMTSLIPISEEGMGTSPWPWQWYWYWCWSSWQTREHTAGIHGDRVHPEREADCKPTFRPCIPGWQLHSLHVPWFWDRGCNFWELSPKSVVCLPANWA